MTSTLRNSVATLTATLAAWLGDEDGLQAVEWVLVVFGVVYPVAWIVFQVMKAVAFYYEVASWTVALPFP